MENSNQENEFNEALRALMQVILPDEKFNSLLEELARETRSILENELQEAYTPTAFIALRQNNGALALAICPIMGFPDSNEEKDLLFESFGKAIEAQNCGSPIAFFTATEAWMAAVEKDDTFDIPIFCRPDRKEVILISGTTIDGRTNACSMLIDRNGDNKILLREAKITPYEEENGERFKSRLAEMFFYGCASAQVNEFFKANPDIPVGGTDQLLQSWDNPTI